MGHKKRVLASRDAGQRQGFIGSASCSIIGGCYVDSFACFRD